MKLRNKKTGEIWDIGKVLVNDYPCWETLTQICEDWEDVKEPLIKDEKIRKAVRAWAESNGFNADYYEFNIKTLPAGTRFSVGHYDIEFIGFFIYDLQTENSYTLAELCGEEEE